MLPGYSDFYDSVLDLFQKKKQADVRNVGLPMMTFGTAIDICL